MWNGWSLMTSSSACRSPAADWCRHLANSTKHTVVGLIDWLILSYYVKNMTWRHSHNRKYMTYCISSEFGHAVFEICERIDTQTRWSQYVAPLVGEVDVEWMSCSLWRCEGSAGRLGSPCLTGRRCIGSHVVCTANNLCQCDTGFFVKNAQCREFSF